MVLLTAPHPLTHRQNQRAAEIRDALQAIETRQKDAGLQKASTVDTPAKRALWERVVRIRRATERRAAEEFPTHGFSCRGIVTLRPEF